jgi:hypothetical protein
MVQPYALVGASNILDGRNKIAHYFLTKTNADTLFCLDSDIVFNLEDFQFMMEGGEQVVVAPYARKVLGMPPVDFGMGFCRIHRSVFDTLNDWTNPEGEEMLPRYYADGEVLTHFYYSGASSDARWFGEDTGFFHWCALNHISMRQERRTRLRHVGPFEFAYPQQIPEHLLPRGPAAVDIGRDSDDGAGHDAPELQSTG